MEQKEFITTYSEEKEYKLADLKDFEVDLLRRVIDICWEAREKGNHPFGCLLADAEGNILMEQGNEENSLSGDCTAHAETHLMRKASQKYSKEELRNFTMYNCGDPCAMCAGAIYWSNLGRLVYIGRESELKKVTGDDLRNPTLDLPSRVVFSRGQKEIEVLGPFLELEDELMKVHEGYWNPSEASRD
ncbi:MAG: nucleoside deaminase [Clostridiales bacterium]|jgi:tRNA(Arg) A34 adenosine deaminase TadA|nr:nucleoside deaminase [Clostridiales bacterium]MDD3540921.1 nucleoside deaminase [Eubacteriales bacterium]MDY0120006.1 nucleoside deaminase [Clostridia bacterium]